MGVSVVGRRGVAEPRQRDPALELTLAALAITAILLVAFVLPAPLWHGEPAVRPAADQPPAAGQGLLGLGVAAVFALALCLPFRPYALAARAAARASHLVAQVLVLTALLALVGVAIYPRYGTDLWEYVAYERLWRVYGENPLIATPSMHPQDWANPLAWYPERPNAYGPLWHVLAWPVGAVGGESPLANLLAHKFLALAGYLACVALLWRGALPERRVAALVGFAWNPLVLFEVLGKAHNDVVVAAALLAAALLAARGAGAAGLLVAAAAVLLKASAAPAGIVFLRRLLLARAWGQLAVGAALSFALTLALYLPFWVGPGTFDGVRSQASQVVWSLGALGMLAATAATGAPHEPAVRAMLGLGWIGALALVVRFAPVCSGADLAGAAGVCLLLSMTLLATAFYAHYLVPLIALAALSGWRRLERLVLALSVGSLAAYAVGVLGIAFGSAWLGSPGYQLAGSLVTFAPAAGLLSWMWLRSQRLAPGRAQRGLAT